MKRDLKKKKDKSKTSAEQARGNLPTKNKEEKISQALRVSGDGGKVRRPPGQQ